jgi:hypothetical protein
MVAAVALESLLGLLLVPLQMGALFSCRLALFDRLVEVGDALPVVSNHAMLIPDIPNSFLRVDREVLVVLGSKSNPEYTDLIFDHLRPDLPGGYLGWFRWVWTEDGKIDCIPLDHHAIFREE